MMVNNNTVINVYNTGYLVLRSDGIGTLYVYSITVWLRC